MRSVFHCIVSANFGIYFLFRGFVWLCFVWIAFAAGSSYAFEAIYAFGDSLTDTGRKPAESPLHYQGRWSNGPLWIEDLSALLGITYNPSNNFARSGAKTDDLQSQISEMGVPQRPEVSLFVVWMGGNDFLDNYESIQLDDNRWNQIIAEAVNSLSNSVVRLHGLGARHVLVPNLVDMTQVPSVKAFIDNLGFLSGLLRAYAQSKVGQLNGMLNEALTKIAAERTNLNVIRFDTYQFTQDVVASPAAYGFTKTFPDALSDFSLANKSFTGPGNSYLFWDPIHPSARTHALIAERFHALLPRVAALRLALRHAEPGRLMLSLTGLELGKTYAVQRSQDLSAWNDQQILPPASGSTNVITLTNDAARAFFRLQSR